MPGIKIVKEDDPNCGIIPHKDQPKSLLTGKFVHVRSQIPDEYEKATKPKKASSRMSVKNFPTGLTPRGYKKLKTFMEESEEEYSKIVEECRRSNKLWEDPSFPANNSSIGNNPNVTAARWMRPKEINPKAEFSLGGASRFDINQGALGDCWLLAVVSSLTNYPQLFNYVVPKGQTISKEGYCGVFRFYFWQFGEWQQVFVDDRLPVNRNGELVFMHSNDSREFWSALLEKAFAKVNGSYANLDGGSQAEAMEDTTGGLCESIDLQGDAKPKDLAEKLITYVNRCTLMGCCVQSDVIEGKMAYGLISGHAYSLTAVEEVICNRKRVVLVRLRNPWGGNYEWTGPWSDRSKEWDLVSREDQERLKLSFDSDGEFWMSIDDFCTYFTTVEVCHLGLGSLEESGSIRGSSRLNTAIFTGEWKSGINAGGCANNFKTFWTNPQYEVNVSDVDPDDDDDLCTLIIGLMQKNVRKQSGADYYDIGFCVYELPQDSVGNKDKSFFQRTRPYKVSEYTNSREVTLSLKVPPGKYLIVPTTFEPNTEASFIVRVFTLVPMEEKTLDGNTEMSDLSKKIFQFIMNDEDNRREDEKVEKLFNKLCVDGAINAKHLQTILNESALRDVPDFDGFNLELCRSMLAAMDDNQTGKLEMSEFKDLWNSCQCWKAIFVKKDTNANGSFDSGEFREALADAGFNLSFKVLSAIIFRYCDEDTKEVDFESFITCCVRLKNNFANMREQSANLEGSLTFTPEDFLRLAMYS